ncbi:MAG TPA: hypothetical protein VII33_01460 [Nakamurella sp.]
MHKIKNTTRLAVVLATLGILALTFAGRASAAATMVPRPGGNGGLADPSVPIPVPPVVHTVVVSGMPGWQIVVIAIAAALVAAAAAVLLDRTRSVRRRLPVTAA